MWRPTNGQLQYWRRKTRAAGFTIHTAAREVDVYPYTSFGDIPIGPRYYVGKLIRSGYNVQLKIR